jgi:hypothetical protein
LVLKSKTVALDALYFGTAHQSVRVLIHSL